MVLYDSSGVYRSSRNINDHIEQSTIDVTKLKISEVPQDQLIYCPSYGVVKYMDNPV